MEVRELIAQARANRDLPPPVARRMIRETAGVSQSALGSAVGVAQQTVAQWEAGTVKPKGDHLRAYVDLLRALQAAMAA